jgi:hypothetical protein
MSDPKPSFEAIPKREDKKPHDPAARQKLFDDVQELAARTMTPGPRAARSLNFLYDENGLPA